MDELKFSDSLLDSAYTILAYSQCNTEEEKARFRIIRETCKDHDVSFMKFMETLIDLNKRMCETDD